MGKPMDGVVDHVGSGEFLRWWDPKDVMRYFADSVHNNWDGWEEEDLVVIRQLMADIFLNIHSYGYDHRHPGEVK